MLNETQKKVFLNILNLHAAAEVANRGEGDLKPVGQIGIKADEEFYTKLKKAGFIEFDSQTSVFKMVEALNELGFEASIGLGIGQRFFDSLNKAQTGSELKVAADHISLANFRGFIESCEESGINCEADKKLLRDVGLLRPQISPVEPVKPAVERNKKKGLDQTR